MTAVQNKPDESKTINMSVNDAWQWAILVIGTVFLAASNPNEQQFKGYAKSNQNFLESMLCTKYQTSNYIIFSRYEINCNSEQYTKYIGVAGTFIFVGIE